MKGKKPTLKMWWNDVIVPFAYLGGAAFLFYQVYLGWQ